jgi:putative oxidoreductase
MHWLFPSFPGGRAAVGFLVLRLVAGSAMMIHGWPKIQDPTGWMNAFPDHPPAFLQAASAVAEFGGGIAWILGALTPLFSFLLVCNMAFATFVVQIMAGHPFVGTPDQPLGATAEAAALYLAIALLFLLAGPGALSVDYLLFGRPRPAAGPAAQA